MGWAIALHGGAGSLKSSSDMPSHEQELARTALRHCLDVGTSALQSSRSALDAVELVVRALEDDQIFNAGKGSVLTEKGTVEMEASIMDGRTKLCGAASGLSTVVNPISLARLVMEKSPHVYLAFDGAEQFAKLQGAKTADASYFITQQNVERLQKAKAANSIQLDYAEGGDLPNGTSNTKPTCRYVGGTVGCVAVDSKGHCAAATSTGGVVNKMVGRIGDSPIIGAGTYANQVCAVSATGKGEHFIRATVGKEVAALVEYKGLSVKEAVMEVVDKQLQPGTGGVIAVSNTGEICMHFNTSAMFRACADESGYSHVAIWH